MRRERRGPALRDADPEGFWTDEDMGGGVTDEVAIGRNFKRVRGVHFEIMGEQVMNIRMVGMLAAAETPKLQERFPASDRLDQVYVQEPVIDFGVRGNFHPTSGNRGIAGADKQEAFLENSPIAGDSHKWGLVTP